MFLFRAAFWLMLVVLLIPADPQGGADAPRVSIFQAFGAARAAIADVSAFCDRNPDVCATGSSTFQLMEAKARYGMKMIQHYLDDGKTTEANGTLSAKDRETPWQAPKEPAKASI
jgi:hypothetical protein